MLSMSNVSSAASASSYYAEDNYYSKEQHQAMSAWEGKGAEALGLAGTVDQADFAGVLSGAVGGEQLGRVVGTGPDGEPLREHRPGFDVTLSAPKSVSLVAEVDERGNVRAAHEAAVGKVLEYIERNLVGARVTEAGETRFEKTGNLVAARFHHTTSRDLDPQTHTHLVIANATKTAGGHWRSVSNELIYDNQKLLGQIYDSELAANLRGLGYRLEATPEGRWEIAGVSRGQVEHFSQRSQAIAERLERFGLKRGTASAAEREDAALHTRNSKTTVDHAALREEWKARAGAMGVDFDKIEAARQLGAQKPIDPGARDAKADEAARFAITHLTERESVVARGEVLQAALNHVLKDAVWAGVRLGQVEAALDGKVARKDALQTGDGGITTPQALERERSMLSMLEGGRGAVAPIMAAARIDTAIAGFEAKRTVDAGVPFRLTTGQEEAARAALGSGDRFVGLQGYAGVGKTTMLELVRGAAEEAGYTVRGMAPSAQAAMTLQGESGIASVTTARFLLDEGRRAAEAGKPGEMTFFGAIDLKGLQHRSWSVELPVASRSGRGSKELWVMDEASLAGQSEVTTLMEMANGAGARLILVGDRLQLNAVEAGKPFEMLRRAGIDGAEMTDINRQQVADLKRAVAAAVRRENAQALNHLKERIVEVPDRAALLHRIAADILGKHPGDRNQALLVVPLNSDRHAINKLVREGLQGRGEIGADQLGRSVLVPTGFTDAQKQSSAYYEPDMVVRFGRAYRSLDMERGAYATVVGVDRPGHAVTLESAHGKRIVWSPGKHGKVEVYEKDARALAVGDELRFTRGDKGMAVANGTLGKVAAISASEIVLDTQKGRVVLKAGEMSHGHWDYAYAMTVHASQGKTAADANLLIASDSGRAMGERSFYVGITRPRTDMTIYTDSRERAIELIQEAQNKTSAVEALTSGEPMSGQRADDEAGGKQAKGSSGGRAAEAER